MHVDALGAGHLPGKRWIGGVGQVVGDQAPTVDISPAQVQEPAVGIDGHVVAGGKPAFSHPLDKRDDAVVHI